MLAHPPEKRAPVVKIKIKENIQTLNLILK